MGRKPTISRETLLDRADEIVRNSGAGALTIGALAQAADISKGGVQYSFASRDELVRALVARWTNQFDVALDNAAKDDPIDLVRHYIAAMRASQKVMDAKMAGLMVSYLEDPTNRQETRDWYLGIFERLGGRSPVEQAARVAFFAVEGLFLLHMSGLNEEGSWTAFLDDVEAVLDRLIE